MWTKRLAAVTIGTLVTGLLIGGTVDTASTAAQSAPGDLPLHGDLNGDGHPDRATLHFISDGCAVTVEHGDGSGGYGPATLHPYQAPGNDEVPAWCPNRGIIIDLGGDGSAELVVGWNESPFVNYGLLVLENYQPVATLSGPWEISQIEMATFNDDDLPDLYVTDYWNGFFTYLNTPAGELVAGPLSYRAHDPRIELADFNDNGIMDAVIAYTDSYTPPGRPAGVAVGLDDGTVVYLQNGPPAGADNWTATVLDADRDGHPDVRTEPDGGGPVTTFINDGAGGFVVAPDAVDDTVDVWRFVPRIIDVRANDYASAEATLTVVTLPRYGRLIDVHWLGLVYLRTAWHRQPDSFAYRLTENGSQDTATVTIRVKG